MKQKYIDNIFRYSYCSNMDSYNPSYQIWNNEMLNFVNSSLEHVKAYFFCLFSQNIFRPLPYVQTY
jgi:hypothetical protein